MKVLVADDDHVTTVLLSSRLKRAGYDVQVAHHAMQAIMLALRMVPDAILLDVNMSSGTGLQVLRQLKNSLKTNSIPIVVISGSCDAETRATVKDFGSDAFLDKPPDWDRLFRVLAELLPPAPRPAAPQQHGRL